jgi:hypothetical protein
MPCLSFAVEATRCCSCSGDAVGKETKLIMTDNEIIYPPKKKPGEFSAWYKTNVQKSREFKNEDRTAENIKRNITMEVLQTLQPC